MNFNNKTSSELWAVLDENGKVLWSRGGSSTRPKLMVYESEKKARGALKSPWIKQIHNEQRVKVCKIYSI